MEQRFGGGRRSFTPEEEARLQQQEHTERSARVLEERRRREEEQVFPSTEIENSVIANMAEIGVYSFAVYSVLKMHQASGEVNPSYAEIARMTGMDRSTVIRSMKKLTDLNLVSLVRRFNEDGSQASHQYNLRSPESR
jgi:predicted transcriptional regulator